MQSFKASDLVESMDRELHDLAQPVTSIQCRLELAILEGDPTNLRQAIEGGLEDLSRLREIFSRMRALIIAAKAGI